MSYTNDKYNLLHLHIESERITRGGVWEEGFWWQVKTDGGEIKAAVEESIKGD